MKRILLSILVYLIFAFCSLFVYKQYPYIESVIIIFYIGAFAEWIIQTYIKTK